MRGVQNYLCIPAYNENSLFVERTINYLRFTPNTLCVLQLDRRNSSALVTFEAQLSNNQGIAVFDWGETAATGFSDGTWDASVTANGQTSTLERLKIDL